MDFRLIATVELLWRSAAACGVIAPASPPAIRAEFIPTIALLFPLILEIKFRLILRRTGRESSPSSGSIMSAVSLAMELEFPIAIPTVAAESAGESLIPSPTMTTLWPSLLSFSMRESFVSGRASARNSVTPVFSATFFAVFLLSPVIIMIFLNPELFSF